MRFLIVDAFTEQTFGGNPAGVVILPDGADFPTDEIMVKTAAELRYSETAFIRQLSDKEFNIRYFTPAAEVDLCGHATIGSFCALAHLGVINPGDTVVNHTLAGDLEIEVGDGSVMMDMASPQFIGAMDDTKAMDELRSIMGGGSDVVIRGAGGEDRALIPEMISTGLPDIIMPLASVEELNGLEPDMKALAELSKKYDVVGVHAFALAEEDGVTAYARNFAPLYDIDEEAATGTSSGAMTYYLYRNGIIGEDADCRFIQGERMGRPSAILSELKKEGDELKIRVGGSAVVLAEGEINI